MRGRVAKSGLRAGVALLVLVGVLAGPAVSPVAAQEELPPGGTFFDDDGSVHEGNIEAIYAAGITQGCTNDGYFCPTEPVLRKYMAAFLHRALELEDVTKEYFTDDGGQFEIDIQTIAAAGITLGCTATEFCPDEPVTREQMAAFLVRAYEWDTGQEVEDSFRDDDDSVFEREINILAAEGVTLGCTDRYYCPRAGVERQEMASFLARAMGLEPIVPPPRPEVELVAEYTTYHNCCESRVHNIHLIADTVDGVVVNPGGYFSVNSYVGERTEAKGYVAAPAIIGGEVYCCDHPANIGGGVSQFATTLFNAIFFGGYDDIEHQPHSLYISRYPMGREATLAWTSPDLEFRNDTLTPVTIRTSYTDTSLTVQLYGNNDGRSVEDGLSGSATPAGGGTVTVYRYITFADGTTTTESWTWTYQAPANGLVLPF